MGKAAEPVVGIVDPGFDMKTPPKTQVDTMPAGKFFAYAAELLKVQPPHVTDQPILAQMKRIGIERGKSFDMDKANPAIKTALASVPEDALKLMTWKLPSVARVVNPAESRCVRGRQDWAGNSRSADVDQTRKADHQ
jgi:hypothetical protein